MKKYISVIVLIHLFFVSFVSADDNSKKASIAVTSVSALFEQIGKAIQSEEPIDRVDDLHTQIRKSFSDFQASCLISKMGLQGSASLVPDSLTTELYRIEVKFCRDISPYIEAYAYGATFSVASYLLSHGGDKQKIKGLLRSLVIDLPNTSMAKKAEFALEDMAAEEKKEAIAEKPADKPKKKTKKNP